MMTHDEIREAVAAYSLDALDPAERASSERELLDHLPSCDGCLALMRDLREISGDLALASGSAPVDPALEARILAEIREDAPLLVQAPRRPFAMRAVSIAAALALIASLGWNASLVTRDDGRAQQIAALSAATRLAADPTARSVALRGSDGGVVLLYKPGGPATLLASGLKTPSSGKVLELWLISDGVPTAVVAFRPEDDIVVVPIRHDPAKFRGAAITVENGFVQAPTTEPIYAGDISA